MTEIIYRDLFPSAEAIFMKETAFENTNA